VSSVKYGLGSYIPEDDILHSHCRKNLRYSGQNFSNFLRLCALEPTTALTPGLVSYSEFINSYWICGRDGGDYEEDYLLDCNGIGVRRNISLRSSQSKSKPNEKLA
jgi:hypothetical protein